MTGLRIVSCHRSDSAVRRLCALIAVVRAQSLRSRKLPFAKNRI